MRAGDRPDRAAGTESAALYAESEDLCRLIGRPTTPMAEAVGDALEA